MKRLLAAVVLVFVTVVTASGHVPNRNRFKGTLDGYQLLLAGVGAALNTPAGGSVSVRLQPTDSTATYALTYTNLIGGVTQAHIHFGRVGTNGGVIAFLCSNLGNAPLGTPPCPYSPSQQAGTVAGTLDGATIVGPSGQNLSPGDFLAFMRATRNIAAYVCVHSTAFPGGEIRGQLLPTAVADQDPDGDGDR